MIKIATQTRLFAIGHPLGLVAMVFILLMLMAGLLAPVLAPFDPTATDTSAILQAPSAAHVMGTDEYGRDILSRIMHGARTAMLLALSASLLGSLTGAAIGIASAYFGGWLDALLQRLMDIMLAIPLIVFALVLAAVLKHRMVIGLDLNLVLAVAVPGIPKVARVVRAAALSVRSMPYIDAAHAAGYSPLRIIFGHMAPNLLAPVLVLTTAFAAQAILLEASLSYLGVGVVEPTPAWGLMLSGLGTQVFVEAPWMVVFPGLAVSLTVFSFSLLGDAVRDFMDPRLRL
jgi:peptide/nickel transport system permease protein